MNQLTIINIPTTLKNLFVFSILNNSVSCPLITKINFISKYIVFIKTV